MTDFSKAYFAKQGRRGARTAKLTNTPADFKRWGKAGGQTRWEKRKQKAVEFLVAIGCAAIDAEIIVKHAGPQAILKAKKEASRPRDAPQEKRKPTRSE